MAGGSKSDISRFAFYIINLGLCGAFLSGPTSWKSSAHGCNRAVGEVWCNGECILPMVGNDQFLTCLPENISFSLPDGFAWGSATASYQVEGGVVEDGRGETIWDVFSHTPGKTKNGDTGDVADDHYHKWSEDVDLIVGMGLTHYRCSVAWSRILPEGRGVVNQAGLDFYDHLFNKLIDAGVEPLVTLYHWDLPNTLEVEGGWLNENTIEAYLEYSRVMFDHFGSKVKLWLTFNEPYTFIRQGYSEGHHAPGRCSDRSRCTSGDSFTEPYLVAHNVLIAHARAVAMFRELELPGSIGITLNGEWAEPSDALHEHNEATERYMEAQIGWFADPLKVGDYPTSMKSALGTRLPTFTDQEKLLLVDSWDFFGFNFYNAIYVSDLDPSSVVSTTPFWSLDLGLSSSGWNDNGDQMGLQGESTWLFESPGGLKNILLWINQRYLEGTLPLYITENGCSAPGENEKSFPDILDDSWRVAYFFEYIEAMCSAVSEGVPVVGYFAWSLLDNFEWGDGYQMRFGIHYVDFNDPDRPRHRKSSARWYAALLNTLRHVAQAQEEGVEEGSTIQELPTTSTSLGGFLVVVGLGALVYVLKTKRHTDSNVISQDISSFSQSSPSLEMPSLVPTIRKLNSYSRIA